MKEYFTGSPSLSSKFAKTKEALNIKMTLIFGISMMYNLKILNESWLRAMIYPINIQIREVENQMQRVNNENIFYKKLGIHLEFIC